MGNDPSVKTAPAVSADQPNESKSDGIRSNDPSAVPKVSIMIVSFNQRNFVAEAIESAVNQDYANLEVVISDDGSTDGTAEIIAQLQSRYPGRLIALLNRDNVGVTRNCNRALRACSGQFIAFLGGDDVLLPGKVAAQVAWFKQDERRVLCGHAIEYILEDGSKMLNLHSPVLREGTGPEDLIRHGSPLPAQSIMVRASAVPPHGFDEVISIASDLLFWIEVLSGGGIYGHVDGVFAKYRDHENNVSKQYFAMLKDIELTYQIVANRYPRYRSLCMESIVKNVIYFGGVRCLSCGDKQAARRKFLETIRQKPFFLKAWLRLLQTF